MKRIIIAFLLLGILLSMTGCAFLKSSSTFSILFIDVGQGDSALVECDGHYMLIDAGNKSAGEKVYSILEERGIQKLDILAVSHWHDDHTAGLKKVLSYASSIGITLSNSNNIYSEEFRDIEHELSINGSIITVPHEGEKFKLGSAEVEVVYSSNSDNNDSLVLLITYGETSFLFTGDIEDNAQTTISDKYQSDSDKPYQITLMKLPHHGAKSNTLYRFLRTFMADYIIISVGANNGYGHPHKDTLDLLDNQGYRPRVYRTDLNGDILVKSDGKSLSVDTSR